MRNSARFWYDFIKQYLPGAVESEQKIKALLGMYIKDSKHHREADQLLSEMAGEEFGGLGITRRRLIFLAATAAATSSTVINAKNLFGLAVDGIDGASDFILGEGSDVTEEVLHFIERQGFGTGFTEIPPFAETSDAIKLWQAARAFQINSPETRSHLQFLKSLQFRRGAENAVHAYAAFLRSAIVNRLGAFADAQPILLDGYNADELPHWLFLTNLVEDASQKFIAINPEHIGNPSGWSATPVINKINARFGAELSHNVSAFGDAGSRKRLRDNLSTFQTPFLRAIWLNTISYTADSKLNITERREAWDSQIALYKVALETSIGGYKYRRGIWNECMAMAIQAHRHGDFDYRDIFVTACLDPDVLGIPGSMFQEDMQRRSANMDHSFVMLMIFIQRLKLDGINYQSSVDLDLEFTSILENPDRGGNFQIRTALDAFRKKKSIEISPDDGISIYAGSNSSFASYIIDVPFDG
ncbi:hypothetical protein [Mesorhizobium sp. B2-3-4]|uniref:hypothetical protein n=1 Tax=Mesorhizobium sp. B2-3-4 TaxID=2589959 RepID=UPI001128C391|nr:hypothetical protein [Mesorhizobium sp. B2-3-4]TPM28152.1 hypothetical protein FJ967_29675 [Mesorhizobium sp. B2-3-4]